MGQIDFVMKALGIHGDAMELRVTIRLNTGSFLKFIIFHKLMLEVGIEDSRQIDFPEFLALTSKLAKYVLYW